MFSVILQWKIQNHLHVTQQNANYKIKTMLSPFTEQKYTNFGVIHRAYKKSTIVLREINNRDICSFWSRNLINNYFCFNLLFNWLFNICIFYLYISIMWMQFKRIFLPKFNRKTRHQNTLFCKFFYTFKFVVAWPYFRKLYIQEIFK